MRQKKYTLPRHTNLAKLGPRIGAFLIDLALSFGLAIGLFYGAFSFIFKSKVNELDAKYNLEVEKSQLYNVVDGVIQNWNKDSDNNEIKNGLVHFYTVYIPVEEASAGEPVILTDGTKVNKLDYFTVEWFNTNILDVEGDGRAYFEYVVVGEIPDKTQVANIKADAEHELVNRYLQEACLKARYDFNKLPTVKKLTNSSGFLVSSEFVMAALVATSLVYILVPFIFKRGVTVGKKLFGLCLATSDGYLIQDWQLFMRVMPIDVLILALLIPIWTDLAILISTYVIILLISFAISMASPKHSALHDFTARTIVVDARTSILFEDMGHEELYIADEDNISLEREVGGEEPELKYEK